LNRARDGIVAAGDKGFIRPHQREERMTNVDDANRERESTSREIWFESGGARLYAVDLGHGHAIVFLHGGLADHRSALFRVGSLAASHRVLAPDLRGSGRSIYSGALSWDQLADDVCALLEHVQVERAIVGGVSAGSAVAVRFALRHPQRTLGLVLMSPVYAGQDRGLTEAQVTAFRAMEEAGQRALEQGVESLRPLYERLPPQIRQRAIEMMLGFDAASVAASMRFLASGAQPMGAAQELASIDAPVLLVPGADPEHPPEVAALYVQHIRRHVVVDPASADLAERIEAFCGAVGRTADHDSDGPRSHPW
jgi:pimeloyl-ACP methyl ester carboxylesterase